MVPQEEKKLQYQMKADNFLNPKIYYSFNIFAIKTKTT